MPTEKQIENFSQKLEKLMGYNEPYVVRAYKQSTSIPEPFKTIFIEALRSEKYLQCYGALSQKGHYNGIVSHCVNGVCAEISGAKKENHAYTFATNYSYDGSIMHYSNSYVDSNTATFLEYLNDKMRLSFKQIADIIEEFL